MERIPVSSGMLNSVGYDPETQILEVEFNSGRVYQYQNVPEDVHRELLLSESHGIYFNENIRENYAHREVTARD